MELDSLLLVYFLDCSIKVYTGLVSLVDDKIHVSLVGISQKELKGVYNEANLCVDALATIGRDQAQDLTLFSSPSYTIFCCINFGHK